MSEATQGGVGDRPSVAMPGKVVLSFQSHKTRVTDPAGHVSAESKGDGAIITSVKHRGRRSQRVQVLSRVQPVGSRKGRPGLSRRSRPTLKLCELASLGTGGTGDEYVREEP